MIRALLILVVLSSLPLRAAETTLFDFEAPTDLAAWSNLRLAGAKEQEPEMKFERVAEHATAGKHSLKLTFAGGRWPTLSTAAVPEDWAEFHTLQADITVSRPCLVGLAVIQEKSTRGADWDGV